MLPKILVILGPTASGKSDLAVKLAKKFSGEVVSADSRQVYRGLNIGTGKITKKEMGGVPHHLLDVASPKSNFSVSQYKRLADKAISKILRQGKLPIICGGTGFYIQTVVDGVILPEVAPNKDLRAKLEKKSLLQLQQLLKKLDPKRFKEIDQKNRVRLIRAIEIASALGKVPRVKTKPKYNALQIGLRLPDKILKQRISDRLATRLKKGMVAEAKRHHHPPAGGGLSYKRMEQLGLEYRYLAQYLKNQITKPEMIEKLETEIWHYAKRQLTWFRKDNRIKWFKPSETTKIQSMVKKFLA